MKLSAVLLSWKRPYHLPSICANLRKFPEVGEIILVQNEHRQLSNEGRTWISECDADTVMWEEQNHVVLGRAIGAMIAQYDDLLFADDDLLVHNVPTLVSLYEAHNSQTIICNLLEDKTSRHWTWFNARRPPYCEVAFGSICPKQYAISILDWPYDHYLLQRKFDKILTVMYPWLGVRAGPDDFTRLYYNGVMSGKDENALYKRDDHRPLTNKTVQLAQKWKQTWKPSPS